MCSLVMWQRGMCSFGGCVPYAADALVMSIILDYPYHAGNVPVGCG